MCDKAAKQKSRVQLKVKLHKNLLSVICKVRGLDIPIPGISSPPEFC